MTITSLATTPTSTPPSPPNLDPAPTLGPITKLPLELVTHTLNSLLDTCTTLLERQSESQRWLRVCRAFRAGHALSQAAHECAVQTAAQANLLAAQLKLQTDAGAVSVRKLWVGAKTDRRDQAVADLVQACAAGLTSFVWAPAEDSYKDRSEEGPNGPLQAGMIEAWEACAEMNEFGIGYPGREMRAQDMQRWVERSGWVRLPC